MIASAIISVSVACVAAYNRMPWSDEGWFSSSAYNLAHHGFMGTTVLDPRQTGLVGIDRHTYCPMPLYPVAQAAWYRVFPATIFWTRALSFILIPVLMVAFYQFLVMLFSDTAVASLATVLLACSFILIDKDRKSVV